MESCAPVQDGSCLSQQGRLFAALQLLASYFTKEASTVRASGVSEPKRNGLRV